MDIVTEYLVNKSDQSGKIHSGVDVIYQTRVRVFDRVF